MNIETKENAKIRVPTYQELVSTDTTPLADVLAQKSNPPQPTDDIPFNQYISPEFFELEMQKMWPRTWQYACRDEHIPEPGDYTVYDIGRYSILVVRQEDGVLKAFHNSCMHRGTKLKPSDSVGSSPEIQCPFHGWTYQLDGTLGEVPCSWEFPHLDYEANHLREVQVESWNSFIFINMDPGAPPLLDYLEVMPEHFVNWRFEDWSIHIHIEKELNCNWKVALEGFMEAYHTPVVHPEMTHVVGDWSMQHDIYGDNVSRDLCPLGVPSPTSTLGLSEQEVMDRLMLGDPSSRVEGENIIPEGMTARNVLAARTRKTFDEKYDIDLSRLCDAEVVDSLKYNIFPNMILFGGPGLPQILLFKPDGMDPDKCVFEILMFRPVTPGEPRPDPAQPGRIREEQSFNDVGMGSYGGAIFDQDTSIMRWQQEGMHASAKGAETLSTYQESRIRRIHETLDKYINS